MARADRVVIVGGGPTAAECAAGLRMAGFTGMLTVVSDDPYLPYARPAVSKAYLAGTASLDKILIRPASTYTTHDIEVRLNTRADSIAPVDHRLALSDGTSLEYDSLVLATGGRPRMLPANVVSGGTVAYLRSAADADALRRWMNPASRIVVVGGGYLGLEVAAVGRESGAAVTVLEALPRVLARVTSPTVSEFFQRVHAEEGVEVRLGTGVAGIRAQDETGRTCVDLSTGERLIADVVMVSIGLEPAVELALAAGLDVHDGVVVDEFCRTSNPDIFAAGDCTRHPCFENGGTRRLESFPNANEQAGVVAAALMGKPVSYRATPWFWSEQFNVTLQSVGLSRDDDELVVRGSTTSGRSFSAFYLRAGEIRAADVVANPREFAVAKKLVSRRTTVDLKELRDTSIPLKQLAARQYPSSASSL